MIQWEKLEKKKAEECVFLFKKKIFLKDDDREMEDLVAKDLIYKQVCLSLSLVVAIGASRSRWKLVLPIELFVGLVWFGLVWSHY
jgi:hypothetical protein